MADAIGTLWAPVGEALDTLQGVGRFAAFTGRVTWRILTFQVFAAETVHHLATVLYRCLIPVCATIAPVGLVMALQGSQVFKLFGAERLLSFLIGQAVFRELGPVLTAVLLAAQGGSSFAAELGAMRVQEQLDATEVMGVDPISYHVAPRVLALGLSAPLLNVFGSAVGVLSGFVGAVVLYGQDPATFWHTLYSQVNLTDVLNGTLKACLFGSAIGLIACFHGFHVKGGALGVGKAVNDTVVHAVVTFLVMNYFLTTALFGVDL